jgi:hypothetical protein
VSQNIFRCKANFTASIFSAIDADRSLATFNSLYCIALQSLSGFL